MGIRQRLASLCFPRFAEDLARAKDNPHSISILMYHEVLPDSMDMPLWHVVQESQFRQQMEYLKHTCDVLSVDQAVNSLKADPTSREVSRPRVVITFDDGYSGNYETAMPILAEFQLPWTVYVATSAVEDGDRYWYDDVASALLTGTDSVHKIATSQGDITFTRFGLTADRIWLAVDSCLELIKRLPQEERKQIGNRMRDHASDCPINMMNPEQVADLADAAEVTVGCHTHDHNLLDTITCEEAFRTIDKAQVRLREWCGSRARHFSYPNGNFNDRIVKLVDRSGFRSAVTTEHRVAEPGEHPLKLPRIAIGRFDKLNLFRAKLANFLNLAAVSNAYILLY